MADLRRHICSNLTGRVVKTSPYPIRRGCFADVYLGDLEGKAVAIKIPRVHAIGEGRLNQVSDFPTLYAALVV
jgi:hypothetical protein